VQLQASQLQAERFSIRSAERVKFTEISCVFLWDSSNSQGTSYRAMALAATKALSKLLSTPQRCTFVDFNSTPRVAGGSTNNPADLISAISKSKPRGGTAAYDAVFAGIESLDRENLPAPRVMYVFSDFEDNQSHYTRAEMIKSLLKSHTRVYAFTPEVPSPTRGTVALEDIAVRTGGRVVNVPSRSKPEQMEKALNRELELISGELNSWFRIELVSSGKLKRDKVSSIKITSADKAIQLKVPPLLCG
jgi:hypothetical protein